MGNLPPSAPALLAQYLSDNVTPLPLGGTVADGIVMVKALIADFNMDAVKLQVEMRPNGTAFSGAMTHESIYVTSGTIATVQVSGLSGPCHWQVRAVDSNGAGGAWVANGGSPDFTAGAGTDTRDAPNGDCSGSAAAGIDFPLLVAGFMAIGLLAAAVMPRKDRP